MSYIIKRLVILRHGHQSNGFLTPDGVKQVSSVAEALGVKYHFTDQNTIVIGSRERRAVKTAQCINKVLGLTESLDPRPYYPELFSDDRTCDTKAALKLVQTFAEKYENVIVITHYELAPALTQMVARQWYNIPKMYTGAPYYGQGFLLNLEHQEGEPIG